MKTCVTCKHFKKGWFTEMKYSRCMAPGAGRIDPVTGERRGNYTDITRKAHYGVCGPEGVLWMAKK